MGIPKRTKKLRVKKKRVIEYLDCVHPYWQSNPNASWSNAYNLIMYQNKLMYKYYRATTDVEREEIKSEAKQTELKIKMMFRRS